MHLPRLTSTESGRPYQNQNRYMSTNSWGEIPLLADYKVDWNLLSALVDFWDKGKAIFIINGTELTPTIEEYHQLTCGSKWNGDIIEPRLEASEAGMPSYSLALRVY